MLEEDLRNRVRRMLSGDHRTTDLDRLFLGLRARAGNFPCFREIGDFVAHRDTREKGLVTQVARDLFTSFDVWSLNMRRRAASWADITRAAHANLRLATDQQLKEGCGCSRSTASQRLQKAISKLGAGKSLTDSEIRALEFLGNRFIWRPAFTSDQLLLEFKEVLVKTGIVKRGEVQALDESKRHLSLYALALMHGTAVLLEGGHVAKLFAGFANRHRILEVKVEITFNDLGKPLMAPICIFLTDLSPEANCSPDLLQEENPVLFNHWNFPIDVGADGQLAQFRQPD